MRAAVLRGSRHGPPHLLRQQPPDALKVHSLTPGPPNDLAPRRRGGTFVGMSSRGFSIAARAAALAAAALGAVSCGGAGGSGQPPATNHLRGQKSPYLLQHATNPVDWYPWGNEAFEKARREQKPIFLSIGYSTCHWCHVMEKESFTDAQVAALMNGAFVSVKVDREERPDLDEHFMSVSLLLTGSGGWPLNVVLTPEGKPFFAATYIPRDTAYGRLGMLQLIPKIEEVWKTKRGEVQTSADQIAAEISTSAGETSGGYAVDPGALGTAVKALAASFDKKNGGFGAAPKFPMPTLYPLLFRAWRRNGTAEARTMAERSLAAMRSGGIYDQLGFGFHRYSTDAHWLVPHFEKMLYDQALLALAYTDAWQATADPLFRRTAEEILTYVRRDLGLPGGAFATAEDADSQGTEGTFYVWTAGEIRAALGEKEAAGFISRYGVSDAGNFPGESGASAGQNVLHQDPFSAASPGGQEARLLAARAARPRPSRDDKVLTDWNGLAVAALARAGRAFGDAELVRAAEEAVQFLTRHLRTRDGHLLHRYRDGESAIPAFADDYAFLSWGLLELYEATFDVKHLQDAVALVDAFTARFWDASGAGFYQTADDAKDAPGRRKSFRDGVVPSANSVGLMLLLRLNRITGNIDYEKKAEALLRLYPPDAAAGALEFSNFLSAADFSAGPTYEVVVAGAPGSADTRAMLQALQERYLPNVVLIFRPTDTPDPPITKLAPFTAGQGAVNGKATAYVCRNFVCNLPTNDIAAMLSELGAQ
jgi:uncharacterized protein